MVDDGDEPRREASSSRAVLRVAPKAGKVIGPESIAGVSEDLHDLVGLGGAMPNRGKDQPAIASDELIPSGGGIARLKRGEPRLHATSCSIRDRSDDLRSSSIPPTS